MTSNANTTANGNEAVASFFAATALANSPAIWAMSAEVFTQPLSNGAKVAEIDAANSDCETGSLDALNPGCAKPFVNLILDGIGREVTSTTSFTGSISGTVLTASSVSGTIVPGQALNGTGVAAGTQIISQASGPTGGAGTYNLSGNSQTVGSETMTSTSGFYPATAAVQILQAGNPQFYDGIVVTGSNTIINRTIADLSQSQTSLYVSGQHTNVIDMHTSTCTGPCVLLATGQHIALDSSGANADISYDGTNTNMKGSVNVAANLITGGYVSSSVLYAPGTAPLVLGNVTHGTGVFIADAGGASADFFTFIPGVSGAGSLVMAASGSDTNISIVEKAQGSSVVNFGNSAHGIGLTVADPGAAVTNAVQIKGGISGTDPTISTPATTLRLGNEIQFSAAASFSANGTVATSLGSVGPTGSHTTVQKWLTVKDNTGATLYVPAF